VLVVPPLGALWLVPELDDEALDEEP
jgi:hypothetical protein